MINFKINVSLGLEDCRKTYYNRVGYFYNTEIFERYKVFINNQELSNNDYIFTLNVEPNTTVNVKIVDKTGVIKDYERDIQVFDKDVYIDTILLYNKDYKGVIDYNCHLGIHNTIPDKEFNNEGDFLGGSNYFEWEIHSTSNPLLGVNDSVGVIRVERPRDANGILLPFDIDNFTEWVNSTNYVVVSGVVYPTVIMNDGGILDLQGDVSKAYLIYQEQTQTIVNSGCCGNTVNSFEDCLYPFEITNTIQLEKQYCNAEINIIDTPCSKSKLLYKASNSVYPITIDVYCDGEWKTIGNFTDYYLLDVEKTKAICNKEEFKIRVKCDSEYASCCGNNVQYNNYCEKEYTIKTSDYCPIGELIIKQDVCERTIGCDECGETDRYITEQPIIIDINRDWNNDLYWYYYNKLKIDFIPFENTIQYSIYKKEKDGFILKSLFSVIDETEEPSKIEYTPLESGIYKIKASLTNQCKTVDIEKDIFVYAKNTIVRLDCNNYRLLHCIDRDFNLSITRYKDDKVVYLWDKNNNIEIESDYVKVKYNQDFYAYDFTFLKDDIYKIIYNDIEFILLHDCFITNCHQEYVKTLLCEGDICDVLLDKCRVTDDTMLKVYMIQKYVLLYDIYKSLASKIVNIEYSHIIEPNVLLEDKSCIDLYNLWDIIEKLKEMCIKCGFKTIETDDCGCN